MKGRDATETILSIIEDAMTQYRRGAWDDREFAFRVRRGWRLYCEVKAGKEPNYRFDCPEDRPTPGHGKW